MKRILFGSFVMLVLVCIALLTSSNNQQHSVFVGAAAAEAPNDACVPPAKMASTPEETAWRLFIAATCPVNADKYPYVTWERWIEQGQLYTPTGVVTGFVPDQRPRFHMSPLATETQKRLKRNKKKANLVPNDQDCNSDTWSRRTICEETRLNSEAQNFVSSNGLTTRNGQAQFINAGKTFQFPAPAVEVKVDWIKLASCDNLPSGVHVEKVNDACYALGGLHLISKLIDKWVWATFEPQNKITNPQRCVVLGCKDTWGSEPTTSSGADTQLTQPLKDLMAKANVAPEWANYRLDGVQVDFLESTGKATRLGNSIIEGDNAGDPTAMKSSSCITCHDRSTVTNQGKNAVRPSFVIGNNPPFPATAVRRDFVWSLDIAK